MKKTKNEKKEERGEEKIPLPKLEELKALAERCAVAEEARMRIAGRQARRAIRAMEAGRLNVTDILRAGAKEPRFAALLLLSKTRADHLAYYICNAFGAAELWHGYDIGLGRHAPESDEEIAELCEEFAAAGFKVTPEAIAHNVSAWKSDLKSGYRGEDYHLFSPCGCNDLSLRAEPLIDGADWQTTYMA